MANTPRLAAALGQLHAVFGGMTAPGESGCTHCYSEQDIAFLHRPDVLLPQDLLRMFTHEVPSHFDDHPAVIRRLLPQFGVWLATGGAGDGLGYGGCGLGRAGWPGWPPPQAAATREFIDSWWDDFLRQETSPYDITDVFAYCADMGGTLTPLLTRWAAEPVGGPNDEELVWACERWVRDLLGDDLGSVIPWWHWPDPEGAEGPDGPDGPSPVRELQSWLAEHAPPRLRAAGADPDLITRVQLLALPHDERWAHPYWDGVLSRDSAADTN